MRENAFCALLLTIGILASGCGAPDPPMACFDGEMPDWVWDGDSDAARHDPDRDYGFEYCEYFDMVCNEAVTLEDECPAFMSGLLEYLEESIFPMLSRFLNFLPWLDVDGMLSWIAEELQGACGYVGYLDQIGTCQPPGEAGDPCAEDADCVEGILCLDQVCGGEPAQL
jgi:hypothetical protein